MDAYSVAGKQAEEVLKSVKTVVAYAGEEKEIERFLSVINITQSFFRLKFYIYVYNTEIFKDAIPL